VDTATDDQDVSGVGEGIDPLEDHGRKPTGKEPGGGRTDHPVGRVVREPLAPDVGPGIGEGNAGQRRPEKGKLQKRLAGSGAELE
jgi:hypothetical protein